MTGKEYSHMSNVAVPVSMAGFTLIELIAVLAILTALAAFLLPTIASARGFAYRSACFGNLRQVGLATQMYIEDWDGAYPFAFSPRFKAEVALGGLGDPHGVVARQPAYPGLIQPYLRSRAVLRCPADTGVGFIDGRGTSHVSEAFTAWGTSYDYSADVPEAYLGMSPFAGTSPRDPAMTPLFQDASGAWHGEADSAEAFLGVYQVIYADLHARRAPARQVMLETSEAYVDPFWNP